MSAVYLSKCYINEKATWLNVCAKNIISTLNKTNAMNRFSNVVIAWWKISFSKIDESYFQYD